MAHVPSLLWEELTVIDVVERLRDQGKYAFARQYSLGMFKLCDEAASEIERLRNLCESLADDNERLIRAHPHTAEERSHEPD